MRTKRFLSTLLVLLLILGTLPAGALASERKDGKPAEDAVVPLPADPAPTENPVTDVWLEEEYGLGGEPEEKAFNTWVSDAAEQFPKRSLPASYDSRNLNIVTAVRNQGKYGTCWAHAPLACIETYMIKYGIVDAQTGKPADTDINLSEYHLAWFTYTDAYDQLGLLAGDRTVPILGEDDDSYLDIGGNGNKAAFTMLRGEGPASEQVVGLAYSEADPDGLPAKDAYTHNAAQLLDMECIPCRNRNTVKEKIQTYGACTVSMHYDSDYMNKDTGGYCLIQTVAPDDETYLNSNHDVTIVGWDDNYSRTNFPKNHRPVNNGAWIVKNSHGTGSGKKGYFYLSYEDTVSLGSYCYFYRVAAANSYNRIYQYDGTACLSYSYSTTPEFWVSNSFEMKTNSELGAVSIMTYGEGVSYTLRIVTDPTDPNDPLSGTVLRTVSGELTYAGYHTIRFKPILITTGQRVAAVFELNCPVAEEGQYVRVGVDKDTTTSNCSNYHPQRSGVSHYRTSSQNSWTERTNGNYRIKLLVNTVNLEFRSGTWYAYEQNESDFTLPGLYDTGYQITNLDILSGSLPSGMALLQETKGVRIRGIPSGVGTYNLRLYAVLSNAKRILYHVDVAVNPAVDSSVSTELVLLPVAQELYHPLSGNWGTSTWGGGSLVSGSIAPGADFTFPEGSCPRITGVAHKSGTWQGVFRFYEKNGSRQINDKINFVVYNPAYPIQRATIDFSQGNSWFSLGDYTSFIRPTLLLLKQDGKVGFAEGAANDFMVDLDLDGRYDVYGLLRGGYELGFYPQRTVQRDFTLTFSDAMLSSLSGRTDYIKELTFHIEPHLIPSYTMDLSDNYTHGIPLQEYTEHLLWPLALLHRDGAITVESEDTTTYLDLDKNGTRDVEIELRKEEARFRALDTNSVKSWQRSLTASQQAELQNSNSAVTLRFFLPEPVEKYDLWVDGVQVTEKNRDDVLGNGVFDYNGLTLNIHGNYSFKSILIRSQIPGLLIFTSQDSHMTSVNHQMGLDLAADATIWGPGKLTLEDCRVGVYLDAPDVRVRVHYTELEVSGRWGVAGEDKGETLEVDDASITADAPDGAICDITNLILNKARIVEPPNGYFLDGDVVDSGGSLATHAAIYSDRKYNPFVDVQEGTYYYDAVLWAANRVPQITNGTDDTHFSPGKNCTRGQVVTFLWRANNLPDPGTTTCAFTDVKPGAYYYNAMLWAVNMGITSGKTATTFGPNLECTRAEVVTFLWRAAGSPEPQSTDCPFTDVKPGAFYYKAMLWAVEQHITTGASATAFKPGGICTRGQVVTFLYRAYGPKG